MAVWQFTKDGDISNGEYIISFQQLVEIIERSNSNSIEIDSADMGEMLTHNDFVYINQTSGKFYKSLNTGIANQAQNVVGVYRYAYNKHQIVFAGVIDGLVGLIPGKYYYLSIDPGKLVAATANTNVVVGRAVNTTTLLLDIHGDINIQEASVYDTTIVDGESKEGNGLTDPSQSTEVSFSKKEYDGSVPANIMFIEAGGINSKLDFASEYTGDVFKAVVDNIEYTGMFGVNEDYANPTVLLPVSSITQPEPLPDPVIVNDAVILTAENTIEEGAVITYTATVTHSPTNSPLVINLTNGTTITIPIGELTSGVLSIAPTVDTDTNITVGISSTTGGEYNTLDTTSTVTTLVTDIVDVVVDPPVTPPETNYDTSIVDGAFSDGVSLTDPSGTMTLSFDKKAFDGSVPAIIQFTSADGVFGKIDYATEYTGSPFSVVINGVTYSGVFTQNEDFNNPTILN